MTTHIQGREVRVYWNSRKKRATVVEAGTNKTLAYDTVVVLEDAIVVPPAAKRGRPFVSGILVDIGEDSRDTIPPLARSVPLRTDKLTTADKAYIHNGKVALSV